MYSYNLLNEACVFYLISITIMKIITDTINAVHRGMNYFLAATYTISQLTPWRTALLANPIFTQR